MKAARGYTLVEVLVVLVILGIAAALVQVRFWRTPAQTLDDEGHRLAQVLEFARDEAMTQGCTLTWVSRSEWHRIECRRSGVAYKPHLWPRGVSVERVSIAGVPVSTDAPLFFTPSGINPPFELSLALQGNRVLLSGDV